MMMGINTKYQQDGDGNKIVGKADQNIRTTSLIQFEQTKRSTYTIYVIHALEENVATFCSSSFGFAFDDLSTTSVAIV